MLDTVGPELQILNKAEQPITLEAEAFVMLTPDTTQQSSSSVLSINYPELANVS
jgi:pyruvate kinase